MDKMPRLRLGTFIGLEDNRIADPLLRHRTTVESILSTLRIGYRHLDLAESYGNLPAIAEALRTAFLPIVQGGLGLQRENLDRPYANEIEVNLGCDSAVNRSPLLKFDSMTLMI